MCNTLCFSEQTGEGCEASARQSLGIYSASIAVRSGLQSVMIKAVLETWMWVTH